MAKKVQVFLTFFLLPLLLPLSQAVSSAGRDRRLGKRAQCRLRGAPGGASREEGEGATINREEGQRVAPPTTGYKTDVVILPLSLSPSSPPSRTRPGCALQAPTCARFPPPHEEEERRRKGRRGENWRATERAHARLGRVLSAGSAPGSIPAAPCGRRNAAPSAAVPHACTAQDGREEGRHHKVVSLSDEILITLCLVRSLSLALLFALCLPSRAAVEDRARAI